MVSEGGRMLIVAVGGWDDDVAVTEKRGAAIVNAIVGGGVAIDEAVLAGDMAMGEAIVDRRMDVGEAIG